MTDVRSGGNLKGGGSRNRHAAVKDPGDVEIER
jgi:hypothetical protein